MKFIINPINVIFYNIKAGNLLAVSKVTTNLLNLAESYMNVFIPNVATSLTTVPTTNS